MKIDKQVLVGMGVKESNAQRFIEDLNSKLPKHGINTPRRVAHFLAQIVHESAKMAKTKEGLSYSAERLREVFPRKFPTLASAKKYERKPEKTANRIYANKIGNGNEASGDGFRFHGRGLMQLTGRANYKQLSNWIRDPEIMNNPDLVSGKYAVDCAVFFWIKRDINEIADTDDAQAVTRKINGGFNGLADRLTLLDKAKRLLARHPLSGADDDPVHDPVAGLDGATHRVTADGLNVRSSPEVPKKSPQKNRIGAIGQGDEVIKVRDADIQGWYLVHVLLHGELRRGFVSGKHLEPIGKEDSGTEKKAQTPEPAAKPKKAQPKAEVFSIPVAHMKEGRADITRARDGGRAYPLGESGQPLRDATEPADKATQIIKIVKHLDSAKAAHKRYMRGSGNTYCNIYAHDFCYLSGVYLPRVWWTDKALQRIRGGATDVRVTYIKTVRELNANMLTDWFEDFGSIYGWENVSDLDTLQNAANNGEVCIIVAKRKQLNRSGHIVAVVPESSQFKAKRKGGVVVQPVESQAGSVNFRFKTKASQWWQGAKFSEFGYWRHE